MLDISYTHAHTHTHTHTNASTCAHTHTQTHARTHTDTCTQNLVGTWYHMYHELNTLLLYLHVLIYLLTMCMYMGSDGEAMKCYTGRMSDRKGNDSSYFTTVYGQTVHTLTGMNATCMYICMMILKEVTPSLFVCLSVLGQTPNTAESEDISQRK